MRSLCFVRGSHGDEKRSQCVGLCAAWGWASNGASVSKLLTFFGQCLARGRGVSYGADKGRPRIMSSVGTALSWIGRSFPSFFSVACMTVALGLGACTSVPDALNPVEWWNQTVEFFTVPDEDTVSRVDRGAGRGHTAGRSRKTAARCGQALSKPGIGSRTPACPRRRGGAGRRWPGRRSQQAPLRSPASTPGRGRDGGRDGCRDAAAGTATTGDAGCSRPSDPGQSRPGRIASGRGLGARGAIRDRAATQPGFRDLQGEADGRTRARR